MCPLCVQAEYREFSADRPLPLIHLSEVSVSKRFAMIAVDREAVNIGREIASHVRHRLNSTHPDSYSSNNNSTVETNRLLQCLERAEPPNLTSAESKSKTAEASSSDDLQKSNKSKNILEHQPKSDERSFSSNASNLSQKEDLSQRAKVADISTFPSSSYLSPDVRIQVKGADHITLANKFQRKDFAFIRDLALKSEDFSCAKSLPTILRRITLGSKSEKDINNDIASQSAPDRLSWDIVVHEGVAAEFHSEWKEIYRRTLFAQS